jgi:hypothetical protein
MAGKARGKVAALVLMGMLALPGQSGAGPLLDCVRWHKSHCPPGSYSPCHYWTPALYRCKAFHHPLPPVGAPPPSESACITPSYKVLKFPCPPVDPVAFYNGLSSR